MLRRGLLAQTGVRGGEGDEAVPVYRQHGLLRAYALTLLCQADEEAEPATRHTSFYAALAKQDWRAGEAFWEQVEHAWQWVRTRGLDEALAYLKSLSDFLPLRGRWNLYRSATEELLQRVQAQDERAGDQARLLNSLGLIAHAVGVQRETLSYFGQALPLWRQVGDRIGEATTLNNIGAVYAALGDWQRALEYYEQALPIRRQVGDRAGEAITLNNIGGVYDALDEKQQALAYYKQALPIQCQVGGQAGERVTHYSMAMTYRDMNRLAEAEEQLQQVVALDEVIQHPDLESDRETLARVRAMRRETGPEGEDHE